MPIRVGTRYTRGVNILIIIVVTVHHYAALIVGKPGILDVSLSSLFIPINLFSALSYDTIVKFALEI
jgi:hypothetical protein